VEGNRGEALLLARSPPAAGPALVSLCGVRCLLTARLGLLGHPASQRDDMSMSRPTDESCLVESSDASWIACEIGA
jgi:hypothetical protein